MSRNIDVVTLSGDEYDALLLDAERYRFLRDEDNWGEDSGEDTWAILGEYSGEWFDQVVDARIAKALAEQENENG